MYTWCTRGVHFHLANGRCARRMTHHAKDQVWTTHMRIRTGGGGLGSQTAQAAGYVAKLKRTADCMQLDGILGLLTWMVLTLGAAASAALLGQRRAFAGRSRAKPHMRKRRKERHAWHKPRYMRSKRRHSQGRDSPIDKPYPDTVVASLTNDHMSGVSDGALGRRRRSHAHHNWL